MASNKRRQEGRKIRRAKETARRRREIASKVNLYEDEIRQGIRNEGDVELDSLLTDVKDIMVIEDALGDQYNFRFTHRGRGPKGTRPEEQLRLNEIAKAPNMASNPDTLLSMALAAVQAKNRNPDVIPVGSDRRKIDTRLREALDRQGILAKDFGRLEIGGTQGGKPREPGFKEGFYDERTPQQSTDIRDAIVGDLDRGYNPKTGAPYGEPFMIEDATAPTGYREVRVPLDVGHVIAHKVLHDKTKLARESGVDVDPRYDLNRTNDWRNLMAENASENRSTTYEDKQGIEPSAERLVQLYKDRLRNSAYDAESVSEHLIQMQRLYGDSNPLD